MTFEKFNSYVRMYRPDVVELSAHQITRGKGNKVLISFRKPNGKESKGYEYSGSYGAILAKLFEYTTEEELAYYEKELDEYKKAHGTVGKGLFSSGLPRDFTKQIAYTEEKLKELKKLPVLEV